MEVKLTVLWAHEGYILHTAEPLHLSVARQFARDNLSCFCLGVARFNYLSIVVLAKITMTGAAKWRDRLRRLRKPFSRSSPVVTSQTDPSSSGSHSIAKPIPSKPTLSTPSVARSSLSSSSL